MKLKNLAATAISLFGAVIFLDSLRYKFTDHPKTQVIFGALDGWASSLGLPGLFAHTGLFSQYVIGSAELVASILLLVGLLPRLQRLNALGALIAFAVMSGAVSFHLLTPLGIDPNHDGGGLFAAAATLLTGSAILILIRLPDIAGLLGDLSRAFIQAPSDDMAPMGKPARA
ncbi:hypothetical protein PbB2_00415 [Candidatus Phycosocius bacilliformis]|uniref:DoxX family protein n=1 Tax=Candidatus Phycosocius bacilliformis TaxID=1445552 RepID=A0A2P2E6T9_9PROT|nr:DoxX family membrane protein [Candidatus Phycosocius bacilliformis]GBF56758.1 hypothetical protein PbB2_00415 [Candidatus Phycosocius bacilliformis]